MSIKPLSYDSLKTVLQHMEANLRFELSRCIPSIRVAEKSVPLKIDRLVFDTTSITVNKTKYMLGIQRKYHVPVVPDYIRDKDEVVPCDLDEYGKLDFSTYSIFLPGDVVIDDLQNVLDKRTNDELIQEKEGVLRRLHQQLAETLKYPNGDSEFIKEWIKETRADLLSYYHRRSKVLPPYNSFIQLTIDSPRGKKIERVRYNFKIYKALKSLNESFFGKRRHVVNVQVLNTCSVNIIRLPLGLKLKIRELIASTSIPTIYKALQPIVEKSSYPLNCLELLGDNMEDLEHHVVKTTAKLGITWMPLLMPLLPTLINLKNQEVFVTFVKCWPDVSPNEDDYILLIQNWLETGREIGTCFTFEIENKKSGSDFVEMIKERFNCASIGERFAIIPMNTTSEFKICYEENPNIKSEEDYWILKMEVIQNRTSTSST